MPKSGFKALLALWSLRRSGKRQRPQWDRMVLIFSTAVTLGLVALYVYGKLAGSW